MERRQFIKGSLAGAATLSSGLIRTGDSSAFPTSPPISSQGRFSNIVDVNVYLSRWPFRRIPFDDPAELVDMLRARGVTEAWTGSFDGVFHKDIASVNSRLAESCRRYGEDLLVPIGSVNPRLANWQIDIEHIDEEHGMPGIRLHPGYHNYTLDEPIVAAVFEEAARRELLVQIVPWMQDERHHTPLMPVPTPETNPLAGWASEYPELTLMILNGFRLGDDLGPLTDAGNVLFDFAKLDVITPLDGYLDNVPTERIVFGSYSPMFYFESATLKLQESRLTDAQIGAITRENARRVLSA